MGPLFGFPLNDSENPPPSRKQATMGVIVGGVLAMAIGFLLIFAPRAAINPAAAVVIGVMVIVTLLSLAAVTITNWQRSKEQEKRKRGLDGVDMYSLIDRMVDDLDEEELDHLRRRIEEREHGPKRDMADSLDELLIQRAQDRETRRE